MANKYIHAVAGMLAITSSLGFAQDIPSDVISDYAEQAGANVQHQPLPLGRVMVSARDKTTAILSDNGRYKFMAPIVDTWLGIEIKTLDDAIYSTNHLSLEKINFKPEMLDPLNFGSGEQTFLAFVSPDDAASTEFLASIAPLESDYHFQIVVVPSKDTPYGVSLAYACPQDKQVTLNALMKGGSSDLRPADGCDVNSLSNRLIAFNLLGFSDLPAVLAPSTRLAISSPGEGKTWEQFFMENTL